MSLYSEYDNFHPVYTRQQCRKGGQSRAQTAQRDAFGRFLPKAGTLTLPAKHGQAGGKALLNKYGREYFSNLAKKKKDKTK